MLLDHTMTKAIAASRYQTSRAGRRVPRPVRSQDCALVTAWHAVAFFLNAVRGLVPHGQAR